MIPRQYDSITARDIMLPFKKLVVLRPDMDALAAVRLLVRNKISGAPVVDDKKKYLGVFSEKTSMQFLLRLNYDRLPSSDVRAFMNSEPERTINEGMLLLSVMELFLQTPYRRLPVLADGVLVGQISRRDVLAASTKSLEQETQHPTKQPLYLSALSRHRDLAVRSF